MIRAWIQALAGRRRQRADARFNEVEARTRDLEVRANGLLGGLGSGPFSSLFRGSGIEPDGIRPYQAGDGLRVVDWRVTARKGRLHVRELVEERGLDVLVVLDRSASLEEGAGRSGTMAMEAAAALALASGRAGHRVGLMQVTDQVEEFIPPARAMLHVRRLLWTMVALEPAGAGTDLPPALETARAVLPTGALVILVSDFRGPAERREAMSAAVAGLAGHGSVLLVRVQSPGLLDVPDVGVVEIVDPETGSPMLFDTGSAAAREHLRAAEGTWAAWWSALRSLAGGFAVTLETQSDLAAQLHRAFEAYGRRAA